MIQQAAIAGRVIRGDGWARKIGYPTANLDSRYFRINPQPSGVSAAIAWVGGQRYHALSVIGVPGPSAPHGKIELHLLDFDRDIHGSYIAARLIEQIRPIRQFQNFGRLIRAIQHDIHEARTILRAEDREEKRCISAITQAAAILERRMRHIASLLKPGRSERDVRDRLVSLFRPYQPSFPFIVASGPSAAFMHHSPTHRKLRTGDEVLIDCGIRINGFCSDLSRTYFLGQPNQEQRRRYAAVLRSQAAGLKALKPFVLCRDVDEAARSVLRKERHGKAFIHGTGHALGRKIHELPSISARSRGIVLPGQVLTVEPGVYFKKSGGVRIEDMVLVKKSMCEVLTKRIPKNLKEVIRS